MLLASSVMTITLHTWSALGTYAARFRCLIHAYCLMTNHVHILLTPSDSAGCSQLMKHMAQRHSRKINAKRVRTGTLWEGRFYSGLVASEDYALACYRYIELNPVRAKIVQLPALYRWSSYNANTGTISDGFLHPHPAYLALAEASSNRTAAYRGLCEEPLQQDVTDEIRKATRGGHRMGEPRKPRGRPKRSAENGDCHQLKMVTVTI